MTELDAISLIKKAGFHANDPQEWVDLGCGSRLFSLALANLLPDKSKILMVDKVNQAPFISSVSGVHLEFLHSDFTQSITQLPGFDGILMANSLHYVENKMPFIQSLNHKIKEGGQLIIIEYDTTESNPWIPFPITMHELEELCMEAGFVSLMKTGERPSRYGHKSMYACAIR